jgi:hypothetical protein
MAAAASKAGIRAEPVTTTANLEPPAVTGELAATVHVGHELDVLSDLAAEVGLLLMELSCSR